MPFLAAQAGARADNNNPQEDVVEIEISFTSVLESTVVLIQFIFVILKVVFLIFVNILAHPAFLGYLLLSAVTMFNQPDAIAFEHSSDVGHAPVGKTDAATSVIVDHNEAVAYTQSASNDTTAEVIVAAVVSNVTQAVNNVTRVNSDSTSTTAQPTQFPHYLTLILVRSCLTMYGSSC